MGFDISFHPVPWALLTETIHPWILGDLPPNALDSLVVDAVRLAHVRRRANAYGLALQHMDTPPEAFDPHLHLWGRPFFVAASGAEAIAQTVDRYLAAQPAEVDAIAREQLELIEPGLAQRVQPVADDKVPSEQQLVSNARTWMHLMRLSVAAVREGQTEVKGARGRAHDPRALLQRDLFFTVLEFCSIFQPGWMSKGMLWPTHLLAEAEVGTDDLFIANTALVMPIFKGFPDLQWVHSDSIYENYMVGGCASPKQIPMVREAIEANVKARDDWAKLNLRKVEEALADALLRNVPFAEATEIYRGAAGTLN